MHITVNIKCNKGYNVKESWETYVLSQDKIRLKQVGQEKYRDIRDNRTSLDITSSYGVKIEDKWLPITKMEYERLSNLLDKSNREVAQQVNDQEKFYNRKKIWTEEDVDNLMGIEVE